MTEAGNKQKSFRMRQTAYALLLWVVFLSASVVADGQNPVQKEVPADYGYVVKPGQQVPEFEMTLTVGKKVKMSDLKGRVVMLQFTASWCGVCRKEMPFIEAEIWQQGKEKGLVVIGIDRDEPKETVLKFSRDMNITYPLALDPGADIFGLYALKTAGVTRNVIINRGGESFFLRGFLTVRNLTE